MSDHSLHHDCEEHDCFVSSSRRSFLRDSFLSMAGALMAVGVAKNVAFAMPLEFTEAKSRSGSRHGYGIPAVDGAQIDKDNQVIIVRWESAVYAFNLSCPHQNTALRWDDRDHGFQCPKHHSKYKPSGEFISGRATRGMDRLAITRDASGINVDVDRMFQQDQDPAGWASAMVVVK